VRDDRLLNGVDSRLRPYAAALVQVARSVARGAFVNSGRRSRREQAALFTAAREGRSRFPAAAPGSSKHERGLAFDLGGVSASQLRRLGRLWERWGGRWGGRFRHRDPIHFESRSG